VTFHVNSHRLSRAAVPLLALTGLTWQASAQSPAERIRAARAQLQIQAIDSAMATLRAVVASTRATASERAEAHVWLGVANFYAAQDSAVGFHFRAALIEDVFLKADGLAALDPVLADLWAKEQGVALCGAPLPAWTAGSPRPTPLNAVAAGIDPPTHQSGPALWYPEHLRAARIQGRVLVRAVLDSAGIVRPGSIRILRSPHPGFDGVVMDYIAHARFDPARSGGRGVPACFVLPVDFRVRTSP
jgi:TonB family protein